ncbi:hypothetical protein AVEN_219949-1 [Araneus ventricosus]|uniref:Uncharacterized protein n=1 Tax=Araneus ventricosus TaxID=182803 RepID=A0A4Y2NCQ4_ARAVE|nr:hypothetical protein AVEN_219949-1 [Araneus ventricosus]
MKSQTLIHIHSPEWMIYSKVQSKEKSNVIADMLSWLDYDQKIPSCEENPVSIDFPARSPMEIRKEQLKDEDLRKIIHCFENDDKDVNHAN